MALDRPFVVADSSLAELEVAESSDVKLLEFVVMDCYTLAGPVVTAPGRFLALIVSGKFPVVTAFGKFPVVSTAPCG